MNTPSDDDVPNISPDGKYWFSSVNGDIYWRSAHVIEDARIRAKP